MTAPEPVSFVVHLLRHYTRPGQRLLDVGCGPALYRHVTEADYTGLDVTDGPYKEGLARDVDLIGAADAIPAADGSFDVVFTLSAMYMFPSAEAALDEFRRVLRPGGRLLVVDYNRRAQRRLEPPGERYPRWTQWGLRRLVRSRGFREAEILLPLERDPLPFERRLRPVAQELAGQWAVVTALR